MSVAGVLVSGFAQPGRVEFTGRVPIFHPSLPRKRLALPPSGDKPRSFNAASVGHSVGALARDLQQPQLTSHFEPGEVRSPPEAVHAKAGWELIERRERS